VTKVVTFYSYKGGVGRTMALVNVAHVLARDGWRVLMVDFDLEAPGMTHFFREQVRNRPKTVTKDALDLLLHAKSTINWDPIEKKPKPPELPKSLAEYVVPIPLPDKWKDKVIPYRTGRLDLLPATLDPVEPEEAPEAEPSQNYLQRMDMLDLQGVFDTGGPRHWFGNHVRQYFVNARFRTKGDILFTLRDKVWAAYDIVLVDSRTGLNEVAGLCIGPLCDALVICTGLNDQSIYGTKYFMKKSGLFDKDKAKPYTLVAGPVPPWHTRESDERIALLRKELRCETSADIPYHPAAALIEKTFILDQPSEPISLAYESLAPVLSGLVAIEAIEEPERWAMHISIGLREEDPSWQLLQRVVADSLSPWRWRKRWRGFGLVGPIASFPCATSVTAMPRTKPEPGEGYSHAEPLDWSGIPLAAAISAYRLSSHRPMSRAWDLLTNMRDHDAREELGVRLIFFELRVLGPMADCNRARGVLDSVKENASEWSKTMAPHLYPGYALRLVDFWMTVQSLAGHKTHSRSAAGHENLFALTSRVQEQVQRFEENWVYGVYPWRHTMMQPPRAHLREFILEAAPILLTGDPDRRGLSRLAHLVAGMQVPEPVSDLAEGDRFLSRWLTRPESIDLMFGVAAWGRTWIDSPLGLWPEPLMASATALVRGPKGVEEVVGWLMLSRLVYGYAWRVLVDWRHLASVKDHPLFVEFLRQEDEMVDEIEGAIDRGEYTL